MSKTTNTAAAILRRPAVVQRTGLSYTTIYRKMKRGEFPARVRLGDHSVGWREDQVNAWINEREPVSPGPENAA